MTQSFTGASAIRAAMMVMGSTYVTYALGLVTSVLVARSLGPDDFGRYSYVVWLAGLLIAFGNNGLTTTAIRFVSESLGRASVESANDIHGWLRRRQYLCLLLVSAVFVCAIPFFLPAGWEGHLGFFVAVVLVASVAKALFLFDVSIAKGHGSFSIEAKSTVVISFLNIIAVGIMFLLDAPLEAYLVLFATVGAGYALLSRYMLWKGGFRPSSHAPEPALKQRVGRHLAWTVVLTLTYAISNKSIETWMLNALVGSAAVGYFAIAGSLTKGGIDLLSSGLAAVVMPAMSHAFGAGGTDRANAIMASSLRYFQFLGLLLAGGGVAVAEFAVWLMYGGDYQPVVPVLRIMILVGGLMLVEGAFNALLSTTDNQRLRVMFTVISVGVAALFAIALIPKHGLMGAVVAHAASRIIVSVALTGFVMRVLHLKLPWRELGLQYLSGIIAALPALALMMSTERRWIGLVAAVVYGLVFVSSTVLLKAWRAGDVLHVVDFLERYPRVPRGLRERLQRWAMRLPADA